MIKLGLLHNGKKKHHPLKGLFRKWKENKANLRDRYKMDKRKWDDLSSNIKNWKTNSKLWAQLKLAGKSNEESILTRLAIFKTMVLEKITRWPNFKSKLKGGRARYNKDRMSDMEGKMNWERKYKGCKMSWLEDRKKYLRKQRKTNF